MDADEIKTHFSTGLKEPGKVVSQDILSLRERFLRTMHYQHPEDVPNFEFGYWVETLPLWREQGMPAWVVDEETAYKYFGIESFKGVHVELGLFPIFEDRIIEETENYLVYSNSAKIILKTNKKGYKSIPQFLDFPIKNRDDWKEFKARLLPETPERIPGNLETLDKSLRESGLPRTINFGSYFGWIRDWVGFENLGLLLYDDRELIEDMVETICRIAEFCLPQVLEKIEVDAAGGWEDICFNSGPIIGPSMFNEIVVPRYKRVTRILSRYGIDVISTDCDGNIIPLVPSFLEGGINCMFPLEVHGGGDPVAIREKFGCDVLLMGGVDKLEIAKGKKEIERELLRLKPTFDDGGFIPHIDHRVPANVSFENYKFYLRQKKEIFNTGGNPEY